MRLIDADALKLYLQENLEKPSTSIFGVIAKMEMSDIVEAVCKDIDNQPTIDHVRKGKWIPMVVSSGRDSWQCSVCGRRARGKIENLPYCHCGAKMEEGEQDG